MLVGVSAFTRRLYSVSLVPRGEVSITQSTSGSGKVSYMIRYPVFCDASVREGGVPYQDFFFLIFHSCGEEFSNISPTRSLLVRFQLERDVREDVLV